jgi:hypothetical protein
VLLVGNLRKPPHAQALVTPATVQQFNRRPPAKRLALKIQRAPAATGGSLLDDVKFDLCNTSTNHSQRFGRRI